MKKDNIPPTEEFYGLLNRIKSIQSFAEVAEFYLKRGELPAVQRQLESIKAAEAQALSFLTKLH